MSRPFDLDAFLSNADGAKGMCLYQKGDAVFRQGDKADGVHYILEGDCKVSVLSGRGREAVIALHGKGDFLGEGCLIGQRLRVATVKTLTRSKILRIEKPTLVSLLHSEPRFSDLFVAYLLARTARVEADLVDQLFNSSEKRLARVLLLMANFGQQGTPETVIAKISQETLAEMVGTTRSRISFFMNKFRRLGFIDYNVGDLKIHRSLLNVVLQGDPSVDAGDPPK